MILDGFCGYGGNCIQFALCNPGSIVIGVDNAADHIEMARCRRFLLSFSGYHHFCLLCAGIMHGYTG